MMTKCPLCNDEFLSPFDKEYIKKYNNCWSCDCEAWQAGTLSQGSFTARETSIQFKEMKENTLNEEIQ